ncbi:hypothetical protein Kisp01_14590 [Kineosporia sp. NBRC 101677]|uniref:daptide biosynthesis RiPP recognition protein n=1 Tax=Kineosporia sp. NBRC 101677 TaxID=3032197 RepID=UPI0024A17838|nr:daptide biosynthesis RiPP recognition protein [Kineosporia sp. NBRC 101677]GLY14444.1 hypothetical protein Kisp01_14590 [Kineosporia sp. NBRC 101677]
MPDPTSLTHLAEVTTGTTRSREGRGRLSVFLEDAGHLQTLTRRGIVGPESVVFLPDSAPSAAPTLVNYQGGLGTPGDQLWLDDSFVMEVQSYAVSGFLAVHGPTLLRICGPEDLLALGADAVAARDLGRLPRVATSPLVYLADGPALGRPGAHNRSHRIHVRADGTVTVSPTGSPVATLDTLSADTLTHLAESGAGAETALRAVVDDADLERIHRDIPYLTRYLAVVTAVRAARACGAEVEAVSGFGLRLDPRIPLDDGTATAQRPVIVRTADGALVVDPVQGRIVPLDLASATALERQLDGSGDPDGARLVTALGARGFGTGMELAA